MLTTFVLSFKSNFDILLNFFKNKNLISFEKNKNIICFHYIFYIN